MKKLVALALTLVMAVAFAAPALAAEDKYAGIEAGAWYESAAKAAVDSGAMAGTDAGFEPNGTVTRGQIYQIVYNLAGKPATGGEAPADAAGQWYAPAAGWAMDAGLFDGASFSGGEAVTRAEVAQVMADYAALRNLSVDESGMAMKEAPDYGDIPAQYLPGMTFCYAAKVMVGDDKGNLNPNASLTRAQLAQLLQNFAGVKKYAFDSAKPYDGVMSGLFHQVAISAEGQSGVATYYLPQGLQPWTPAVIVLTPDHTTAQAFSESETGLAWRAVADANKIGLTFLEPANGGTWNLTLAEDGRDDAVVLNQLYMTMRSKGVKNVAPFSMDKSHTTLVGYGQGGAAALLFGARCATDFSAIAAVDATAVPAASLNTVGEQLVLPFPGDSTLGVEEMSIQAKTVDTPVFFVNSDRDNKAVVDYFVAAADAKKAPANDHAETVYQAAGSDTQVWVSAKEQTPATIYSAFLGTTKRFMAMQAGGRVALANDFTKPQYTIHEETVNGELRRWMTYVPTSYDGKEAVPLVVVMHGYTASMYAIAEESRWYDVAEENGFIVLFAQGLVREAPAMGNIPAAIWNAGGFGALFPNLDPMVDVNFINAVLDKTEEAYRIDTSRVYATGHSNGSMMTWALGAQATERFAAISPIGAVVAPSGDFSSDVLLPMWAMVGEFDTAATPKLVEGEVNVNALKAWNEHNGVDESTRADSQQYTDDKTTQWETQTFTSADGAPLVRFTEVKGTPHVYLQEQAATLWSDFFSKYSRGEDGTLYYEDKAVEAGEYAPSDSWYTPAEK